MVKSSGLDDKGLKRGPWSPEEDQKLLTYIQQHGHGSWRSLPQKAGLQRCGKSCRLRWINYLRPDVKRGKFTLHEEQTIIQLHALLGNRWSTIAAYLPKRTDNEIKNHWNTHLKKRLAMMGIDPMTHKPKVAALRSADRNTKNASNLSHMAQWESARLEAEARLVRESKLRQNEPAPAAPATGGSSRLNKQSAASRIAQPRCLDILKAWLNVCQATTGGGDCCGGGGDKRNGSGNGLNVVGCDLESPTSVLKLSEIENFCKYDGRKNVIVEEVFSAGNSSRSNHQQQIGYGESWTMRSGVASNTVAAGGQNNFIEDIIFHNAPAAATADDDGGRHDEQVEVTLSTVHIDDDFCGANGVIDGTILHEVTGPLWSDIFNLADCGGTSSDLQIF